MHPQYSLFHLHFFGINLLLGLKLRLFDRYHVPLVLERCWGLEIAVLQGLAQRKRLLFELLILA